ncbi:hypothetical protein D3C78_1757500 [compost metagenome]
MHYRTVVGVAEVMRLCTAAAHQFSEVAGVVAVVVTVADDFAGRGEQGQAAQVRQGLLELAQ